MARGGRRTGAGRKPGSPNRLTVSLKATLTETARQYTAAAMQCLLNVMGDARASCAARAMCANSILDRGWGRPTQQIEHMGRDGGPIETSEVSDLEVARRIAFILRRAQAK